MALGPYASQIQLLEVVVCTTTPLIARILLLAGRAQDAEALSAQLESVLSSQQIDISTIHDLLGGLEIQNSALEDRIHCAKLEMAAALENFGISLNVVCYNFEISEYVEMTRLTRIYASFDFRFYRYQRTLLSMQNQVVSQSTPYWEEIKEIRRGCLQSWVRLHAELERYILNCYCFRGS